MTNKVRHHMHLRFRKKVQTWIPDGKYLKKMDVSIVDITYDE